MCRDETQFAPGITGTARRFIQLINLSRCGSRRWSADALGPVPDTEMAWLLPYCASCPGIPPRFPIASLIVALLGFSAIAADAQPLQRTVEKLDHSLARSVRAGDSGTKRVIIRTIANGVPGLTNTLRTRNHAVLRAHRSINALTARVPAAALKDLAQLAYVESISIDAVVRAEDYWPDSTLRRNARSPSPHARGRWRRRCRDRLRDRTGT